MDESKDLIISTVTEDFGNSPTIGYVNNTSSPSPVSQANLNQPGLPNPFATKAVIDERIRNEITTSIGNATKSSSSGAKLDVYLVLVWMILNVVSTDYQASWLAAHLILCNHLAYPLLLKPGLLTCLIG